VGSTLLLSFVLRLFSIHVRLCHSLSVVMKISALAVAQVGLLNVLPATAEYVWPSKHDMMEDLLVLQGGYIRHGFIDGSSGVTLHHGRSINIS
jgi:hypothetical protein